MRVRPELDDEDDEEPGRVTTNVILAVLIVLGALPHLEALRHDIEALPGQSPDLLAELRDYAGKKRNCSSPRSAACAQRTRRSTLV